jgi:ADP-heptose:LPS heptosyltransferase
MLTHRRVPKPGRLGYESEASRLVRNIEELGDPRLDDPANWSLGFTEVERESASLALAEAGDRPIIAVSVGTKAQSKDWGEGNWSLLLEQLAFKYPEYALVVCGAPDEYELSNRVAAKWAGRAEGPVINLCGKLEVRTSGAVLERARIFIGHDSGPMHLSASSGVPCVGIFSSRDLPDIWYPHGEHNRILYHDVECAGCRLLICVEQQKKCILSITVDEVLSAVASVLADVDSEPVS